MGWSRFRRTLWRSAPLPRCYTTCGTTSRSASESAIRRFNSIHLTKPTGRIPSPSDRCRSDFTCYRWERGSAVPRRVASGLRGPEHRFACQHHSRRLRRGHTRLCRRPLLRKLCAVRLLRPRSGVRSSIIGIRPVGYARNRQHPSADRPPDEPYSAGHPSRSQGSLTDTQHAPPSRVASVCLEECYVPRSFVGDVLLARGRCARQRASCSDLARNHYARPRAGGCCRDRARPDHGGRGRPDRRVRSVPGQSRH